VKLGSGGYLDDDFGLFETNEHHVVLDRQAAVMPAGLSIIG
jgi:hypothetical protein